MTQKLRKELYNETDMLQGNINRMCVTDDVKELISMFKVVSKRIDKIFELNYERLKGENETD